MENQSSIQKKDGYIIVKARGNRNNFKAVIEGTKQLSDAAVQHGVNFVLADYSDIRFNAGIADAVNLVKIYDLQHSYFNSLVISAVTNQNTLELAKYWESFCMQRGYNYKVFTEYDKALSWLKTKMIELEH